MADEQITPIGVGSTVWVFNENHRVYAQGGRAGDGPLWREHWRPLTITGETRVSWIAGKGYGVVKVPKKNPDPRVFAFSEAEIDKRAWVVQNIHRISGKLQFVTDYDVLRKVADLIGYSEPSDVSRRPTAPNPHVPRTGGERP